MKHSLLPVALLGALATVSLSAGDAAPKAEDKAPAAKRAPDSFVHQMSKTYTPPRDPAVIAKLEEFRDRKFGFFIHWGIYSQWPIDASWVICAERRWKKDRSGPYVNDDLAYKKSYEALKTTFNPVKFDPDKWAAVAADAGTRYVVFTTKHHDGFSMWDTKQTDYKITSPGCPFHTNPRRDVVKEVFDSFRKKNFMIGAYLSKPDWNTPSYWSPDFPLKDRNPNYVIAEHPELWKKFKDFTWAQVDELMTGYGRVDLLWLDGGQVNPRNGQDIDMPGLAAKSRLAQPGLLVADRTVGNGCEDFLTPEGTHAMPARYLPHPWEACMTLGQGWSYNPNSTYMSVGTVVRYLCQAVGRNGNLLLDVGPTPEGELPPVAVERLRGIGAWLRVNGEAIYGTRPLKPYELGDLFFTQKPDGTRYAIIRGKNDAARLPESVKLPAAVAEGVTSVTLLGFDAPLTLTRNAEGEVVVTLPPDARAHPPSEYAWSLKLVRGK